MNRDQAPLPIHDKVKPFDGQVGPWVIGETLKLTLTYQGRDLIRAAITAGDPRVGPAYQARTEYWRIKSPDDFADLRPGSALDLTLASASCTDADLDAFFGDFTRGYACSEIAPAWSQGSYAIPTSALTHFFSMPDLHPDAKGRRLGFSVLFIEGALTGVGWHKTYDPETHYAWEPPVLGTIRNYVTCTGSNAGSLDLPQCDGWWYVLPS